MRERVLSRLGKEVSQIGLGTWPLAGEALGLGYGRCDPGQAEATIQAALNAGVRLFDTADIYGAGSVEELLGRALQAYGDDVTVCSKGGWDSRLGAFNPDPEFLTTSLSESRRRLRRECIDVYLLHNPPASIVGVRELYRPLIRARDRGEIASFGVSVATLEDAWLALDRDEVAVVQLPYNVLLAQRRDDSLLENLAAAGKDVLAREALGNGLLTGKYDVASQFAPDDFRALWPAEVRRQIDADMAWWDRYRRPTESWANFALRFVLERPEVSAVLVGARRPEQVELFKSAGAVPPCGVERRDAGTVAVDATILAEKGM